MSSVFRELRELAGAPVSKSLMETIDLANELAAWLETSDGTGSGLGSYLKSKKLKMFDAPPAALWKISIVERRQAELLCSGKAVKTEGARSLTTKESAVRLVERDLQMKNYNRAVLYFLKPRPAYGMDVSTTAPKILQALKPHVNDDSEARSAFNNLTEFYKMYKHQCEFVGPVPDFTLKNVVSVGLEGKTRVSTTAASAKAILRKIVE